MRLGGITILCAFALLLRPSPSYGAECFALLSEVLTQTKQPAVQTENSKYRLLDSALAYQRLMAQELSDIPNLAIQKDDKLTELRAGFAIQRAVQLALVDIIDLSPNEARHAGVAAHRAFIESLGFNWTEYTRAMPAGLQPEVRSSSQELSAAMTKVFKSVQIDRDFDVPYIAGYSRLNPKYIFVDRSLDTKVELGGGKSGNVGKTTVVETLPFLIIHEVVEVALLRRWKLPSLEYWRSHQIAQRVEKAFLQAQGHSWSEYQGGFIRHNIERLAKQFRFRAIPEDLDLIPYVEEMELEKVKAMKASMQPIRPFQSLHFSVNETLPGVYHLEFKNPDRMAMTFMRFQEHFESPRFRGKIFSTKEYEAWYTKKNGAFTYVQDWGGLDGGFNIPSWVLDPFYQGIFTELSEEERELLAFFETRKHQDFYIIATPLGTNTNILKHELAHATYYLNPEYRNRVAEILENELPKPTLEKIKKWLYQEAGDYHKDVLHDEAHAWIMCNLADMEDAGFDVTEVLRSTSDHLNLLIETYIPNLQK